VEQGVAHDITQALTHVGDRRVAPVLIEHLRDRRPGRYAAAVVLGHLRVAEATSELIDVLPEAVPAAAHRHPGADRQARVAGLHQHADPGAARDHRERLDRAGGELPSRALCSRGLTPVMVTRRQPHVAPPPHPPPTRVAQLTHNAK
jgi:hypothetical protein